MARDQARAKAAIGLRLRALREASGLSPAAVAASAEVTDLDEQAVTEIEAGERDAGFVQVMELLRIYGEREEDFRRHIALGLGARQGIDPA